MRSTSRPRSCSASGSSASRPNWLCAPRGPPPSASIWPRSPTWRSCSARWRSTADRLTLRSRAIDWRRFKVERAASSAAVIGEGKMPRKSASGGLATTISDRATFERADDGARTGLITRDRLVSRLLGAAGAPIAWSSHPPATGRPPCSLNGTRPIRAAIRLDHARRPAQRPGAPGWLDRPWPGRDRVDRSRGSSTRSPPRARASRMSSFHASSNRWASVSSHSSSCSTTSTRCTTRSRSSPC